MNLLLSSGGGFLSDAWVPWSFCPPHSKSDIMLTMSYARSNQLIKQVGEYLVASELARRGLLVATFSGNVPDFDIIATDQKGASCPIQVKTVKGGSWQFTIDRYAEITFNGNKQILGQKKSLPIQDLIYVFVACSETYGGDQFYILEAAQVQEILIRNYARWLDLHGGIRPKNPVSLHCAINVDDLSTYQDNWSLILNRF